MAEIVQLLLKSWLNDAAPANMEFMEGPPLNLVPQFRGELNAVAPLNMLVIPMLPDAGLVTPETSQRDKVWSNATALLNMRYMSVILETSQLLRG